MRGSAVARAIVWLVLLTVLAGSSVTTASPVYPKPQGWVNDYAGVLNPDEKARLEDTLSGLEATTGFEVAVVIVKSVPDETSPKQYATGLFNATQESSTTHPITSAAPNSPRFAGHPSPRLRHLPDVWPAHLVGLGPDQPELLSEVQVVHLVYRPGAESADVLPQRP
ncbi:MAG: TPM domain-containing protein [Bacillota bacterium]|nr:TPM domain-containing protein [Bacillota bacterium]